MKVRFFPAAASPLGRAWLKRGALLFAVLACLLAGAVWLTPLPSALERPTPSTLKLTDRTGKTLAQIPLAAARVQEPVTLVAMGTWLPRVTVALEDRRFFSHGGIDWRGIARSAWRNLRAGRVTGGGSTITQQLIKLSTGRQQRTWSAKLYEAVAAWKLERRWSKERILAEYLNRSAYGNRLIGPEAAARWYFGKGARDLTLAEAIYLAGLPLAPSRLNPLAHPERAEARYQRAVQVLASSHVFPPEQLEPLRGAHVAAGRNPPPRLAPHFTAALLHRDRALAKAGGTVRSTLDLDLQSRAEELVRTHLRSLHRADVTCAAAVILQNSNGAVRAMVGSPDFATAEVNEATATHSAGSTLKPFLYLRGIDQRTFTAATLLPDTAEAVREAYADYDPQDYTKRYLGPVRVREALACSLNVPAVVALSRTGARSVFADLTRWGFTLPRGLDAYGAGFILGNAEVTPLDLAAAYAGLARGGVGVRPSFVEGRVHPGARIASEEAIAIVTDILCDNEARTRGFGTRSPLALSRRIAVKTGTSSGFRDAWTVGFTRDHTVAVWVGNADGRPMREALSTRAAAPLWAALMDGLLPGDAPVELPRESARLHSVHVSPQTGRPPVDSGKVTVAEWFLSGTEPNGDDRAEFANDEQGRSRWLLPPEYAAWSSSPYNTIGAICPAAQKLVITQPPSAARYLIDPALPRSQQRLELACTGTTGRTVRWFVNGQELPPNGAERRQYWQLAEGSWQIRAEAENERAEVTITVE